ncbi:glutathione S-transferase family protein [Trichocoleus sp. DQ-A3]|uniref:glutathione S-transferase family protein n=1 Tax=Cyanophyceae TaxID=3028117 RepID=UPI001686CEE7|nr:MULTISPECIES: glutathione S-transferase family protein [unclassified Coleofasciculus]MBD1888987.1 glutathione S-transferase family protein [Coleofasciculus sp. FACHB-SPT9]MBD1894118.1 glutathione S-transferase family protein [Coleofasciculus sp. FACHB-129]MBD1901361.1 glutathione S-transferase family protein [Coleofasciculus sp. FACHB-125]MBD2086168.1 glutathione S-transferase family protein [Coleofasciculus sp. FACHB-542]
MLELYQFELSHYSEKVRLLLDYKGLPYRKIEVTPGVGQVELFRMSGQRQVPVLKDGNTVIADSTAIAKYLDKQYPDRPLIPVDPKQKGLCLLIEAWADESIGLKSRKVLFGALSQNQSFRTSILPSNTPDALKTLVGALPGEVLNLLGLGVGYGPDAVQAATEDLQQDLESLSLLLLESPYLVGDYPTLADFAVAGLSMLIKFPSGPYLDLPETLRGKGIPGLADRSAYETFFNWRDRLYADYRKPLSANTTAGATGSTPTSIEID